MEFEALVCLILSKDAFCFWEDGRLTIARVEGIEDWVLDEYEDCFSVGNRCELLVSRFSLTDDSGIARANTIMAVKHTKFAGDQ